MFRFEGRKISFRVYIFASAVLVVFILLIPLTGLGRQSSENNSAKVFKMGEEVQSENFKIKVNSIKEGKEIKGRKTPYTYYMVSVTVQNTGKEATKIESSMFRLISQKGEVNLADEDISVLANSGGFIKKQLNPGLSATGYIVFEILKDSAKDFYLLEAFEDEFMGDKVSIRVEN